MDDMATLREMETAGTFGAIWENVLELDSDATEDEMNETIVSYAYSEYGVPHQVTRAYLDL